MRNRQQICYATKSNFSRRYRNYIQKTVDTIHFTSYSYPSVDSNKILNDSLLNVL